MRLDTPRSIDPMADFAQRLTNTRKERKLTQLQLANLLDIQPRLISRWETGVSRPQFDHIVRLANVLEVSIDNLIQGEEASPRQGFEIRNRRLKELCRQVDQLGTQDQEVICHLMDSLIRKEQVKAFMQEALPRAR